MTVPAIIVGTRHITESCYQLFLVHLQQMEEDLGPCFVATAGELSQEEEGELGPQALVVVEPTISGIWGLAVKEWESLVPAYTSSSIFCEKLRSGDAGERDNVSGERGSGSGVSGGCDKFSWLPWLFSRKSSLGTESWSCCGTSQSVCDELCGQGSAGIVSMSNACCGCVVLSVSLWDSSST